MILRAFEGWQVGLGNQLAGSPKALLAQAVMVTTMMQVTLSATYALI